MGTIGLCEPVGRPRHPQTFPLLAEPPEPPRFIREPKDQIGVSGGVASFVCQATGDPKPRVTWNKKGKKVNSQRFEVSWGRVGCPQPHTPSSEVVAGPQMPQGSPSPTSGTAGFTKSTTLPCESSGQALPSLES